MCQYFMEKTQLSWGKPFLLNYRKVRSLQILCLDVEKVPTDGVLVITQAAALEPSAGACSC